MFTNLANLFFLYCVMNKGIIFYFMELFLKYKQLAAEKLICAVLRYIKRSKISEKMIILNLLI